MTTFDVVIPLYQRADLVHRAVAGVLAQTAAPGRVVVVDDGSTDGGGEMVRERFPDVVVVRQENAGVGAARNRGVAECSAPWVAFLDADDVWLPTHLQELGAVVAAHPEAHLVATAHVEMSSTDADDRTGPSWHGVLVAEGQRSAIDYFRRAARDPRVVCSSTAAVRRDTFLRIGGFGSDTTGEDLACWATLALDHPVAISTATTAVYCRGVGGVMEAQRAARRAGTRRTVDGPEGLSPEIAVVAGALEERSWHPTRRRSLEAYLDRRLLDWMRAGVVAGDASLVRMAQAHLRHRLPAREAVMRVLAAAPRPAIDALLDVRHRQREGHRVS